MIKWRIFLLNSHLVGYLLSSFTKRTGVLCPVLVFIGALVMEMRLKSVFQNVNVPVAAMAILTFFVNGLVIEMCLKSILQNVNVPAATMAILTFFVNGLVMEMCLKSIFQNANVPAATIAILTDFFQCSGYAECVWNPILQIVNVPAATMAIHPISWINMAWRNVKELFVKNVSKIHFWKCKCS